MAANKASCRLKWRFCISSLRGYAVSSKTYQSRDFEIGSMELTELIDKEYIISSIISRC